MNSQQELINIIQDITKKNGGAYDTPATVLRVDGDTVWVHIDGGADETPVNKTIACEAGETVQVRIANGSAFLVGNASSPPTDDKRANAAHFIAEQATETATQAVESVEALSQTVKEDYVAAGDSNVHTLSSTMYQNANGVNIFNDELAAGDSYAHIDGDSFEIKQTVATGVIDDVNDISLASFAENARVGKESESHVEINQDSILLIIHTGEAQRYDPKWTINKYGITYDDEQYVSDGVSLSNTRLLFSPTAGNLYTYTSIYRHGVAEFSRSETAPYNNFTYTQIDGGKITSKNGSISSIQERSTIINCDKISVKGYTKLSLESVVDSSNKTEIRDGTIYISGEVRELSTSRQKYVSNPVTEGTAGQVLTTDGNGGRSWTTVSGSGEYVPEPATEGTAGQVLTTDGNGGRSWTTVPSSGEYVPEPAAEGTRGQVLTTDGNGGRIWTTVSSSGVPEEYTFHISNTAASTAVAWCNKVARVKFIDPDLRNTAFYNPYWPDYAPPTFVGEVGARITIEVCVGEPSGSRSRLFGNVTSLPITSITLYDKATAKQTIASTNFELMVITTSGMNFTIDIFVKSSFVTDAVVANLTAVKNSTSPGFAAIYAANTMDIYGYVVGNKIVDTTIGFPLAMNTFPTKNRITQHIGDFFLPTGGPRWNLEIEVDPGTAYYAVCYLENTTTGAYFNHSICYAGVPVPTLAAPTVAPAPVAGKTITFVGTTWSPFVAGVAGVVTDGVVTTKPRLRIQGYHASNTPTAGLGMHMRLFRIY